PSSAPDPAATNRPPGANASDPTRRPGGPRVAFSTGVAAMSQSRAVPSRPADASCPRARLNASTCVPPEWPASFATTLAGAIGHDGFGKSIHIDPKEIASEPV